MTEYHLGGNIQNEILREEHDHDNNAKRVNVVAGTITANSQATVTLYSTPTIYAVVNTGAVGITNSIVTVSSIEPGTGATNLGKAEDGAHTSGDVGVMALGVRNSGMSDLTTDSGDYSPIGVSGVGSVFSTIVTAAGDDITSASGLNVVFTNPMPTGTNYIGLVTACSRNAGTTKTLIPKPIALSASGDATIFVPSNTFKVTHMLLNSDATVRMTIKSGASYLVGNASVGVTLSPNGGWVENGSPDSPVYVGLAGAASFVVNSNVTANIGGKVIYFDE